MKRIVKNVEKLQHACKPITFMTDAGVDKNFGLETIAAIKEVLEKKSELVALAAPQIGIDARVFCIKFNDGIKTFMNPIITKKSNPKFICETCASFPGKQFLLLRPTELEIKYYNDEFKYEDNKLLGVSASIFDQMYQLLDGVLPIDTALVSDIEADGELTDEDLADEEFMKAAYELYTKLVAQRVKSVSEELKDDEATNKAYRQLAFAESVVNGHAQVINPELDKEITAAKKMANKSIVVDNANKKQASKAQLRAFVAGKKK